MSGPIALFRQNQFVVARQSENVLTTVVLDFEHLVFSQQVASADFGHFLMLATLRIITCYNARIGWLEFVSGQEISPVIHVIREKGLDKTLRIG